MIVSNTTPLSVFLRVGRPDLLAQVFGTITIPDAVANELDRGVHLVGNWRTALPSVMISPTVSSPMLDRLLAEVDAGEAEAIALAAGQGADLLLIDDAGGRLAARRLGVPVLGSVGIVLLAKTRGLIESGRPVLDALRSRGGLWLADALYLEVLKTLGES